MICIPCAANAVDACLALRGSLDVAAKSKMESRRFKLRVDANGPS